LLNLNPKSIGWKYLSFQVARLTQDQTLQDDSKSEEVVIVPLAGNGLLSFNDETLELGRDDLFQQKPATCKNDFSPPTLNHLPLL